MAEREETQRRNDDAGRAGPGRWFYGAMAAVAITGAAFLFIALRPQPDEPESEDRRVAARATSTSAATAPNAMQRGAQQVEFPAEYDTLGVSIGPVDAPLVIREFADYQCPACGAFSPATKRIREEYVASGKVRFVLFDIPLTNIHPHALVSAQAARCAGEQGGYWAMHDALFENQDEWSPASEPVDHFAGYATEIGLDADELERCVESEETRTAVERSYAFAIQIGVRSTPSMLVGNVPIVGSLPYERVRGLIEEQLAAR